MGYMFPLQGLSGLDQTKLYQEHGTVTICGPAKLER